MKNNMGTVDRLIRVILAVVFSALYFTGTVSGITGLILMVLGGIFLATSAIGSCPLYAILGFKTTPKK